LNQKYLAGDNQAANSVALHRETTVTLQAADKREATRLWRLEKLQLLAMAHFPNLCLRIVLNSRHLLTNAVMSRLSPTAYRND